MIKRLLALPISRRFNTMDHLGTADAEDDSGSLTRLAPSPHSEAVAHEFKELSLQPHQYLPPLNERKNGERKSDCSPFSLHLSNVFCGNNDVSLLASSNVNRVSSLAVRKPHYVEFKCYGVWYEICLDQFHLSWQLGSLTLKPQLEYFEAYRMDLFIFFNSFKTTASA